MWLGLLHLTADEARGRACPTGMLVVYERDRSFTVGAPMEAIPTFARLARKAAAQTGGAGMPACRTCGAPLDVPDIDGTLEASCASV